MPPTQDSPPPGDIIAALVAAATEATRNLVRAVPGAVRQVVSDPSLRSAVGAALRELGEQLQQKLEEYEHDPYGFFFDEMVVGAGWASQLVVQREGDHILLEALESALDEEFTERLVEAVEAAPHLTGANRERLVDGLRSLHAPGEHWTGPCDRLLTGVEGAHWQAARGTGVIDEHRRRAHHPRRPRVGGINALVQEKHYGPTLRSTHRRFLDRRLFDRHGHDLRHGQAEHGHRTYALLAAGALAGWLARYAASDLHEELALRLERWFEAYIEALPDTPPVAD